MTVGGGRKHGLCQTGVSKKNCPQNRGKGKENSKENPSKKSPKTKIVVYGWGPSGRKVSKKKRKRPLTRQTHKIFKKSGFGTKRRL